MLTAGIKMFCQKKMITSKNPNNIAVIFLYISSEKCKTQSAKPKRKTQNQLYAFRCSFSLLALSFTLSTYSPTASSIERLGFHPNCFNFSFDAVWSPLSPGGRGTEAI